MIESDIALECFDYTLAKYGKPQSPNLTVVEFIQPNISKLPTCALDDAIAIRDHLIEHNSPYTAHRIWIQSNTCCKWAKRSGLIADNPFAEMRDDFKVDTSEPNLNRNYGT